VAANLDFKIFSKEESVACPVCLQKGLEMTRFPKCPHYFCVDCFRRMVYGTENAWKIQNHPSRVITGLETPAHKETQDPMNYGDDDNESEDENEVANSEFEPINKCPLCKFL